MTRVRTEGLKTLSMGMLTVLSLAMPHAERVMADEKAQGASKGQAESKEKEPQELDPKLVYMPSLRIPVVQNRVLLTYYLLDLRLLAKDADTAEVILHQRPRIIDALFCDLYAILGVSWSPHYHINLAHLKKRMDAAVERVVGKDKVDDVLVQQFTIQKNRIKK